MPKQNFYELAKEKAKKKVAEKVKAKKRAAEPYIAGPKYPDVYVVGNVNVFRPRGMMPTWVQNGETWHINLKDAERENEYHVTCEGSPMIHYFFTGTGRDIKGVQPSKSERGARSVQGEVHTKRSFDDLPEEVQDFVRGNWTSILG
jgi:hypothetical protein